MSVVKTVSLKDGQGTLTTYDIGALAQNVVYDNTDSGLIATNVQDAIDEVIEDIPTKTSDLTNDSNFVVDTHFEQTVTLSTSAETTVTFSNSAILTTSLIDVAVSEWGTVPSDVTVTTGVCTLTFPIAYNAHSVTVRIYVR